MSKPNQAWRCSVMSKLAQRVLRLRITLFINDECAGMFRRVSFLATVRPASRKPAPLAASAVTRAAHLDDLRMHVLGEPVGRQLMAEAALLRLAVDEGAGGGELIAEADIVDEASDVGLRLATFGATGD